LFYILNKSDKISVTDTHTHIIYFCLLTSLLKFTTPGVSGDYLKQIIIHIIGNNQKVIKYGLFPKVIICDHGSNNMKMWKLLGVTIDNPILLIIMQIYFLYTSSTFIKVCLE